MTAKEAYETSKSFKPQIYRFQKWFDERRYNSIMKKIEKRANSGETFCKLGLYNKRIAKRLFENGFHIHEKTRDYGDVVCWGIPCVKGCHWMPKRPEIIKLKNNKSGGYCPQNKPVLPPR